MKYESNQVFGNVVGNVATGLILGAVAAVYWDSKISLTKCERKAPSF